jgi:hypothetical protein
LCYVDESGDSGYVGSKTGGFALGCILINESSWLPALDDVIGFRRYLRNTFKIPPRAELKANYLLHNKGKLRNLKIAPAVRLKIYWMALGLLSKLADGQGVKVFAVVVDEAAMQAQKRADDPARVAWEVLIERLERFTFYERSMCAVFPDEGNYEMIRGIIREKRRYSTVPAHFGGPALSRPASFILEDPSARRSDQSYFVQLADLVAYASYRAVFPGARFDDRFWNHIGAARLAAINRLAGGPVAIKVFPT